MRRTVSKINTLFIRAGFILLLVLLAVYIPLKIFISQNPGVADGTSLSIFVTTELAGYREPCG